MTVGVRLGWLASCAVFAAAPSNWKPIAHTDVVEVPVPSQAGQFVTVCIEQRDLDLKLSLGAITVDGTEYGVECLHAEGTDKPPRNVKIEAVDKRYGRGFYRIVSVAKRTLRPSDANRIAAQGALAKAAQLEDRGDWSSRRAALAAYIQGIDLARRGYDPRREAELLTRRGSLYHSMGEYQTAIDDLRMAVRLWGQLPDLLQAFVARWDWNRIMSHVGRRNAIMTEEQILDAWQQFGDRRGLASAYRGLSRVAKDRYGLDGVRRFLSKAEEFCVAIDDRMCEAKVTEELGRHLRDRGDLPGAIAKCQKRLQIAEEMQDERGRGAALAALGDLHCDAGNYVDCASFLMAAREIRLAQGDRSAVTADETSISRALLRIGRVEEALFWARQAIKRHDSVNSSLKEPVWRSEIASSWWLARLADAWAAKAAGDCDRDCWSEGFRDIDLRRGKFLIERYPEPRTTASIHDLTEEGDIVLSFLRGVDNGYVWVSDATGFRHVDLGSTPTFQLIRTWRRKLHMGVPAKIEAEAVSRALLGPLRNMLKGRRLIVSAGSEFATIPFAALPDPTRNYEVPLAENWEIIYTPSLEFLANSRREWADRPVNRARIAVLGDPTYDGPTQVRDQEVARVSRTVFSSGYVPRLPFSRREAADIVRASDGKAVAYLGPEASRALLLGERLKRFESIHLAAHGVLNPEAPELSGVILALQDRDGNPTRGLVRLADILHREWPYRLVVLSACRTALGKPLQTEPPLGLTAAFLRSGARTVIASLWNVDDEATAFTMRHFYDAYLRQGLGPAAALAFAQRQIRATPRWRHPYFWAGFVAVGDWLP